MNFKFMRKFLFILLIIIPGLYAFGQETKVISDLRFIGELGLEKSLFHNWKVGAEAALKLEKNISRIDEMDLDLNIGYSPLKFLDLTVGYRLANNHKNNNTYEKKYRYFGEIKLDQDIRRFNFEYRLRYQNIDDDFFQQELNQPSKNILRNRIQFSYNIRKLPFEPFTSLELCGLLDSHENFMSKIKFILGAKYNLKQFGKLKIYYRIDRELNASYPYMYYNLGISYSYNF